MNAAERLVACRNDGMSILRDLIADADAIDREIAWTATLADVAAPFGAAFVGKLYPYIGEIKPSEDRLLNGLPLPPHGSDHYSSLLTLAVRLHRIQEKMDQLDAAPKKLAGRHPIDDSRILAEARTLMKTDGLNEHQAAARLFPNKDKNRARIYGKLVEGKTK